MSSEFLGFGPHSWDLGLKAGIWASRLEFWPQGWDFGLKVGFWASRLGFGSQGWDLGLKLRGVGQTDGRRRRNFCICESKGHRPLWGRCPKRLMHLLLPKCMVSLFITAPAHQHATWVAMNLALFSFHDTRISSVQVFSPWEC